MDPSSHDDSTSNRLRPFDKFWNPHLSKRLLTFVSIAMFIAILGNGWAVLFRDGSALAKYLERLEPTHAGVDANGATAMEQTLHGEKTRAVGMNPRDPAPQIQLIRQADLFIAITCLVLTALLPFLGHRHPSFPWLYLIPAIWLFLNALAASLNGGKPHSELSVPAQATRFILPVVLALLLWRPSSTAARSAANRLLRIACALTFGIHGYEALRLHPAFQEMIGNFGMIFGVEFPSMVIHALLHAIGTMDILLAISVLLVHKPGLLRWMAFWGLITALARPLTLSWLAWPEFAIRLANSVCPWLILALGVSALWPERRRIGNSIRSTV